jgi:hypothetical protein
LWIFLSDIVKALKGTAEMCRFGLNRALFLTGQELFFAAVMRDGSDRRWIGIGR